MKIKEFINFLIEEEGMNNGEVSNSIGVTPSMVTKYKSGAILPRIDVARRIYKLYKVVLYPYDEKALKELE